MLLTGCGLEEQSPIKVGILHSFSAEMADGASSNKQFAREAKRLIADEQVAVIFGCWSSLGHRGHAYLVVLRQPSWAA